MRLSLTVCDVCKDKEREAKTYKVQSEGRIATTDRCEEHNAPLEEVLKTGAHDGPSSSGRLRRERRNRTTTMEAIEAQKAARNR